MKSIIGKQRSSIQLKNLILFLLLIGVFFAIKAGVFAQNNVENWNKPINLSQSAGANDPRIVVDSLGRSHVLWTTSSNSFVYSRENGDGWSEPTLVELPFGTRRFDLDLLETALTPLYEPELFADQAGNIHALWRDDGGTLFQSSVNADQVAIFEAWSAPQQLAEAALDMNLEISDSGLIHLLYVRPLESAQFPAGIYYRQSDNDGGTWSAPLLLNHSPYFQALESRRANVQVTTTENEQVVVSWENPLQEKLFVIHSGNAGTTWDSIVELDRRQEGDRPDSFGPGQLSMASVGNTVHLIWQAGHQGVDCAIYHQLSSDGGETWQSKQEVLGTISECASGLWLIDDPLGNLLLIDESEDATYLSVWDGQRWSESSFEGEIASFVNPQTFRVIELACKQPVIAGTGTETFPFILSMVGCESQSNRDIWLRSAELLSLIERIAPSVEPVWQPSALLTTAGNIGSLRLVDDSDGQLHAFWSQKAPEVNSSESIFYGRWDGSAWSSARQILTSPDGFFATQPSVIFEFPDKLSAVWVAGDPGEILFSQSNAASAAVPAEWSVAVNLPLPRAAASNPTLARDRDGLLYVAYSIPLNEDRGIYVTASVDGGDSWLDQVIAFDAVESSWDMLDDPKLTIGDDGTLHLMWIRYGSPPLSNPMSIHYSGSTDSGLTWSEPGEVALGNILWGEPLAVGDRAVHRFWYIVDTGIWHEMSIDAGLTWGQLQRLPGSQGVEYPVDVTVDGAGRPHIVAIEFDQESGRGQDALLRHWTWSDDRWVNEESLDVTGTGVESLASAATVGGKLAVLYGSQSDAADGDISMTDIYGSGRELDLPSFVPTPLPTLTPQPTPQATARPTQMPAPTPTVFFPREANADGGLPLPIDTSNPLIGPLVGIIPAAIVILIAFFVVVRIVRGDRR